MEITKRSLFIIFFFVLAWNVYSEKVILKNGRMIYGNIIEKNEKFIIIQSRLGRLKIPRAKIAEITNEQAPTLDQQVQVKHMDRYFWNRPIEIFRISIVTGKWFWHFDELERFNDSAFDFWNSVGEIERFLGADVKKSRQVARIRYQWKQAISISKQLGRIRVGILFSNHYNDWDIETRINDNVFIDEWQIKHRKIGFVIGYPQVMKLQVYPSVEIMKNYMDFWYKDSSNQEVRGKTSFWSVTSYFGFIYDIIPNISVVANIGYCFASKAKWKNLSIWSDYYNKYRLEKKIFKAVDDSQIEANFKGFDFNFGLVIKITKKRR